MNQRKSIAMLLTATLTGVVTLSGCVVVPARGYYAQGPYVAMAPPPPQVEYIGPPPVSGYLWIGGFWGWERGRHVWMNGHWEAPRPGHRWVPNAWVHEGAGWRMHQGHWDR